MSSTVFTEQPVTHMMQLPVAGLLATQCAIISASWACLQAQGLASFLTPMLEYLPDKRASAGQMLRHPWLRGEVPQVTRQRRREPDLRSTRREASRSLSPMSHGGKRSR